MEEGHARGRSGYIHADLPQRPYFLFRPVICGNVVVLWNHVLVLSSFSSQNLVSARMQWLSAGSFRTLGDSHCTLYQGSNLWCMRGLLYMQQLFRTGLLGTKEALYVLQ